MRRWFAIVWLLIIIPVLAQDSAPMYYTTSPQFSGNHFIEGTGSFPDVQTQDVTLNQFDGVFAVQPQWIVGVPNFGFVWSPVPVENFASSFSSSGLISVGNLSLTRETPPLVQRIGNTISAVNPQIPFSSFLSHATPLADGYFAVIEENGDLTVTNFEQLSRLELNIQPDARVVVSSDGRLAVYAEATNQRYVHAIMGDDVEGSALVIMNVVDGQLNILERVDLAGDDVYEGLYPMWADLNEDGVEDLVTTVSNGQIGSRLRAYVFTDSGLQSVEGPAIGTGFRWQHQLAWGAFGTNGEMELIDVRTPHIGGIVRFYRYTDAALEIVAELPGYTSHIINSRNLDMAVAGDFNGDGTPELAIPSQSRTSVAGIQRTENGADVIWDLPVPSPIVTNLAATPLSTGNLALGVGMEDGNLRVWGS